MFINMLMKEMKTSLQDSENNEFNGPLSEYSDLLFSEQISEQSSGIGIAEKVYQFLTGENLPVPQIVYAANQIVDDATKINENFKPNIQSELTKIDIPQKSSVTKEDKNGNFLERVNNRIKMYEGIIEKASENFGVPSELIKAVITAESAGHSNAKSKVGAKGLMQLMDGTARDLGVTDSFDPAQNIFGGALYLRKMLDKFDNKLNLALAAYNAGPGNVEKYGGIPPFRETENYVKKVSKYITQFQTVENSNTGIKI
jgi:Rod binding domain-containing protein